MHISYAPFLNFSVRGALEGEVPCRISNSRKVMKMSQVSVAVKSL